jgi:hypothetical protein
VTFTGSADVGDLVALLCATDGTGTGFDPDAPVTDSAGNSYSYTPQVGSDPRLRPHWAIVTSAISPGATVVVPFNQEQGRKACSAIKVAGIQGPTASALDHAGPGASGSSTTPSITTSTFAQADTIVFTMTWLGSFGSAGDTWTEGANFTSLPIVAPDNRGFRTAYRIVSSSAAINYAPTNSVSRSWTTNYVAFKEAGAAPPPSSRRNCTLLGVC